MLGVPWDDVALTLRISTFSLASLAELAVALSGDGRGCSIVGLDPDNRQAWPNYDWMGVAKSGLESTSRYLARDLGPRGIRVNLVAAGPLRSTAARSILRSPPTPRWVERAPLGWDPDDLPVGRACVALWSDLLPPPPARSSMSTAAATPWALRPSRPGPTPRRRRERAAPPPPGRRAAAVRPPAAAATPATQAASPPPRGRPPRGASRRPTWATPGRPPARPRSGRTRPPTCRRAGSWPTSSACPAPPWWSTGSSTSATGRVTCAPSARATAPRCGTTPSGTSRSRGPWPSTASGCSRPRHPASCAPRSHQRRRAVDGPGRRGPRCHGLQVARPRRRRVVGQCWRPGADRRAPHVPGNGMVASAVAATRCGATGPRTPPPGGVQASACGPRPRSTRRRAACTSGRPTTPPRPRRRAAAR